MLGQPQHTKPSYCTSCKQIIDGASCVNGEAKPNPGDITLCVYCGNVMAFSEDLSLRNLTEQEKVIVANNKEIQKFLNRIHTNPLFAKNNKH